MVQRIHRVAAQHQFKDSSTSESDERRRALLHFLLAAYTNAHHARVPQSADTLLYHCGLFEVGAKMAHSCRPACIFHFVRGDGVDADVAPAEVVVPSSATAVVVPPVVDAPDSASASAGDGDDTQASEYPNDQVFAIRYVAVRPIARGDVLTSSYLNELDLTLPCTLRRQRLEEVKFFTCLCARCLEEVAEVEEQGNAEQERRDVDAAQRLCAYLCSSVHDGGDDTTDDGGNDEIATMAEPRSDRSRLYHYWRHASILAHQWRHTRTAPMTRIAARIERVPHRLALATLRFYLALHRVLCGDVSKSKNKVKNIGANAGATDKAVHPILYARWLYDGTGTTFGDVLGLVDLLELAALDFPLYHEPDAAVVEADKARAFAFVRSVSVEMGEHVEEQDKNATIDAHVMDMIVGRLSATAFRLLKQARACALVARGGSTCAVVEEGREGESDDDEDDGDWFAVCTLAKMYRRRVRLFASK